MNTEQVLQNWLNAYEYHRDPQRREKLATVHHELLPLEALRPVFVSMLIDKARAVAAIADIIRLIVTGQRGRELRFGNLSIPTAKAQSDCIRPQLSIAAVASARHARKLTNSELIRSAWVHSTP